jgi:hypothetical protein
MSHRLSADMGQTSFTKTGPVGNVAVKSRYEQLIAYVPFMESVTTHAQSYEQLIAYVPFMESVTTHAQSTGSESESKEIQDRCYAEGSNHLFGLDHC